MMIKKEERKAFDKIIDVFGLNDRSRALLYSAIENPSKVIPDRFKNLLTEENNYRYVVKEDLNNLKFDALRNAIDYEILPHYPEKYIARTKRISSNKLLNYKIVISKNIKDFLFSSSTGGFTSCFSLDSGYSRAAWTGLPSIFMQKSRVLVMIVPDLEESVKLYGLKTIKMMARAWAFSFGEGLFHSVIYGDEELFFNKVLLMADEKVGQLIKIFEDINYLLVHDEFDILFDIFNKPVLPFFDVERVILSKDKAIMQTLTREHKDETLHMPYYGGTSFNHIYKSLSFTNIADYENENIYAHNCKYCGNRVSISNGLIIDGRFKHVCDKCFSRLFKVKGEYYARNYAINALYSIIKAQDLGAGLYDSTYKVKGDIELPQVSGTLREKLMQIEGGEIRIPQIKIDTNYSKKVLPKARVKVAVSVGGKQEMVKKLKFSDSEDSDRARKNAIDPNIFLVQNLDTGEISKFYFLKKDKIALENTLNPRSKDYFAGDMLLYTATLISKLTGNTINHIIDIGFKKENEVLYNIPLDIYYTYIPTERNNLIGIVKRILVDYEVEDTRYVKYVVLNVPRKSLLGEEENNTDDTLPSINLGDRISSTLEYWTLTYSQEYEAYDLHIDTPETLEEEPPNEEPEEEIEEDSPNRETMAEEIER